MRVLFCGTGWLDVVPLIGVAIARHGVEADVSIRGDRPLIEQLADVDVLLPSNAPIRAAEIAAATRLRLIQQPASGYEWIDLAAARAHDIPVCNAPGANADAVAQATLLLLLALARKWKQAQRTFASATIGGPAGLELTGKTIAIVGVGRTGARVRDAVAALGMRVIAVARGRAALLEALSRADVVTLHAPVTEETRGMINDEAFAAMKPGALLLNIARGALIDRAALDRNIDKLGGLGLDVFWQEPWDPNDPLYARDDVVVLPHVAGSTTEAFARVADVVGRNVAALVGGTAFVHRIV
jgi:phosphoglycerate dehydrogenase-like enzyme